MNAALILLSSPSIRFDEGINVINNRWVLFPNRFGILLGSVRDPLGFSSLTNTRKQFPFLCCTQSHSKSIDSWKLTMNPPPLPPLPPLHLLHLLLFRLQVSGKNRLDHPHSYFDSHRFSTACKDPSGVRILGISRLFSDHPWIHKDSFHPQMKNPEVASLNP